MDVVDGHIEQVNKLYHDGKLFRAIKQLDDLEQSIEKMSPQEKVKSKERIKSKLGCTLEQIRQEKAEVITVRADLMNDSCWTLVKDSAGVKTFYRHDESLPIHSIKLEGVMDCSMINLFVVLYEVDLYTLWWPLSKEVKQLQQVSKYKKLVYMRTELPWPLWSRDACFYAYGVDCWKKTQLLLCFDLVKTAIVLQYQLTMFGLTGKLEESFYSLFLKIKPKLPLSLM